MLEQVISVNNYKEYISRDPNITNDIRRKCREKLENIQCITSEYRALAQADYTDRKSCSRHFSSRNGYQMRNDLL